MRLLTLPPTSIVGLQIKRPEPGAEGLIHRLALIGFGPPPDAAFHLRELDDALCDRRAGLRRPGAS